MGIVLCKVHGQSGGSLVTPALFDAHRNLNLASNDIVPVQYTLLDEYPPSVAWFDRDSVARYGFSRDRVLSIEDLDESERLPQLDLVCCKCFREWLLANGVDLAPSPELQRHRRLHQKLTEALRPSVEATFAASAEAVKLRVGRETSGFSFCPAELKPFLACKMWKVSSISDKGPDLCIFVECCDKATILRCSCRVAVFRPNRYTIDGPTTDVRIDSGDISNQEMERVRSWGTEVAAFFAGQHKRIGAAVSLINGE